MLSSEQALHFRQQFYISWQKYQRQELLEPVEEQILTVILQHSEYHPYLDDPKKHLEAQFSSNNLFENPFLHMALHIGLHEQLSTNRPKGVCDIYKTLTDSNDDPHQVEHRMMEILASEMQQMLQQPDYDEAIYLEKLAGLVIKEN